MILVYTGNGKGKTSAALGTVLRATGYNKKVCIIQFIKDSSQYGEHHAINHFLSDFVDVFYGGIGYYKLPGDKHEDIDHLKAAQETLKLAYKMIKSKKYDLLVLDEIITALMVKLVNEKEILDILDAAPDTLHVILTGRGATQGIIERADLVTDMQEVKHPFQKKEPAVEGIDY